MKLFSSKIPDVSIVPANRHLFFVFRNLKNTLGFQSVRRKTSRFSMYWRSLTTWAVIIMIGITLLLITSCIGQAQQRSSTISSSPIPSSTITSSVSKSSSQESIITEQSDFMWFNYYELQKPSQVWIKANMSGSVQMLEYDVYQKVILSSRAGQLSQKDVQELFELVIDIDFFGLEDRYEPPPGSIYEGDIISVFVSQGDRNKIIVALPPDFIPKGLMKLVERLEVAAKTLKKAPLDDVYLRSQKVDPERAKDIITSGQFRFTTLDERTLSALPTLKDAVEVPGEFVAAGNGEKILNAGFDAPYGYFFVVYGDSTYEVTIFQSK